MQTEVLSANLLQLFVVEKSGPLRLTIPEGSTGLEDLYRELPLGVYSSLRTFEHNKFLYLDWHIARTVQSMSLLGWDYVLDEDALRQALHQVCNAFPEKEMRVRFDVLAQPVTRLKTESRLLIGLCPFEPPPDAVYESGVNVAFAEGLVRTDPLVKKAGFTEARRAYAAGAVEVYEQLLVEENGTILEGTSSNFYGVREGAVLTAGEGVLEGVTRRILLDLMVQLRIPIRFTPVRLEEISTLDEAAISSSSRGIMPVVAVEGQVIGSGRPGPVVRKLHEAYSSFVRREIRTAVD